MDMVNNIGDRPGKAVIAAGLAFVFAIAIVVIANYGISFRLIVPDNAADTARNIAAHEALFRVNIVCDLVYVTSIVVLVAALYVILKPVSPILALVAALCRLVLAFMWSLIALNSLAALRLLGNAAYLPVFDPNQLQTLARLYLTTSYDAYYIGLPFWGLASTVCSYLWFKARYIPRVLAAIGLLASMWCVLCALVFIITPHFATAVNASWFDTPMLIFEIALGLWLLFKGLRSMNVTGAAVSNKGASASAA